MFSIYSSYYTQFFYIASILLVFCSQSWAQRADNGKPQIFLRGYTLAGSKKPTTSQKEFREQFQFENDHISKNGSDYVVNGSISVSFICRSRHPIKWKRPIPEQYLEPEKFAVSVWYNRVSHFPDNESEPSNKLFRGIIVLTTVNNSLSLNLSCESIGTGYSNSVYLYKNGNKKLEREGETIDVNVSEESDQQILELPCRPSLPSLKIILEKQYLNDNEEEEWKPLPEDVLQFNPKIGFMLDKTRFTESVFGLYKCHVEDAHVFVNVIKSEASTELEKFQPRSIFREGGSVHLGQQKLQNIVTVDYFACCSGVDNRLPSIFFESCRSATDCEILKETFASRVKLSQEKHLNLLHYKNVTGRTENTTAAGCLQLPLTLGSTIISCQDENVDYFAHLVAPFPLGGNTSMEAPNETYKPFEALPNLHKSQKMSLNIVGPRSARHRGVYQVNIDIRRSAVNKLNQSRMLYSYEDIYQGESSHIICGGLQLIYAKGYVIRLNWKNGTKTVLPTTANINPRSNVRPNILSKRGRGQTFYSVHSEYSNLEQASLEMNSVDCYLPVWNSSAWEVISYNLTVLPSSPSKFTDKEEEAVHFKQNEKDKEISFEIEQFSPFPFVTVLGCGRRMKMGKQSDTDTILNIPALHMHENQTGLPEVTHLKKLNVTISFPTVTKAIECEYQCIAKNVAGKVNQTIKVIVDYEYIT